jgi:hypothetical protein
MICIIAGNYHEAERWAKGQNLARNEWFYPSDETELYTKYNFHVILVGTAGQNVPASYFDRLYALAQTQGRKNRK